MSFVQYTILCNLCIYFLYSAPTQEKLNAEFVTIIIILHPQHLEKVPKT